jgi:hypothetical protein
MVCNKQNKKQHFLIIIGFFSSCGFKIIIRHLLLPPLMILFFIPLDENKYKKTWISSIYLACMAICTRYENTWNDTLYLYYMIWKNMTWYVVFVLYDMKIHDMILCICTIRYENTWHDMLFLYY